MKILLLGFLKKTPRHEIKRFIQELKKRGHEVNYALWRGVVFSTSSSGLGIKTIKNGKDLKYYDYIIPQNPLAVGGFNKTEGGMRAYYLSHLYRHYLLIVDYANKYHKHVLNEKTTKTMPFYDKLFQHYLLAKNDLPVINSLLYTGRQLPGSVYNKFKKPYIVKSIEGSRGQQVFLIKNPKKILKLIDEFGVGRLLVQKYIKTDKDFRVIVIGNKAIGGMRRIATRGEFRTNVAMGGYTEPVKLSEELKDLAQKAAKVFNAEFAGVDIMKHQGRYYVLEVNIFPMFAGFEEATKINVAEKLVKYIEKNYLWNIETNFPKKERLKRLNDVYLIEKTKAEGHFTKQRFKEELAKRNLILINKEQQPIAYMTHYKKLDTRRITSLVILPKFIGQRLGRRMLKELINIAKKEGDKKIRAVVRVNNERRQKSFLKAGFKQKERLAKHFPEGTDGFVFEYKVVKKKTSSNNKKTIIYKKTRPKLKKKSP